MPLLYMVRTLINVLIIAMLKRVTEGLLEAELKRRSDEKYKFSTEIKAEATRSKRHWKFDE